MLLDFPLHTFEVSPGTSHSFVDLQGQAALTEVQQVIHLEDLERGGVRDP